MKLKAIIFLALVLLMAICATPVYAIPALPHAFYGTLTIGGISAPVGTTVEARGTGVLTGIEGNPITTTVSGQYGSSDPLGDKLAVQGDIADGATITFYVNSSLANETATWHSTYTTQLNLTVTVAVAPTVTAILPVSGPLAGATAVTITGTGFITGATVTIGGTAATSVVVVGATSITAITPAGTAGAKNVVVTTTGGTGTLTGGFTYVAVPTVTAIAPASGTTAGGTAVTITGTNFVTGATVTIGGASATSVVVVGATSITEIGRAHV